MRSKLASLTRAGLLVGMVAMLPVTTAGLAAVEARSAPQIGRLLTVWQLIKANYVEPIDDARIEKGAIAGMLAELDPHSSFLDGASLQRLDTLIDGNYSGLGLSVAMDDGAVKVVSPMRGSPAEKVGIKAGDFITHLDGKLIYGSELDEAVQEMRGEAGTKIRLTIFRPGRDEPFDVTVTRGVIDLEPVTHKLEGRIGVITINEFSRNVGNDVNNAIQAMKRESGGRLGGLVLDLRSNPGGSLDEAVALSDLFLDKGDIVSQRGRIVSENEYYRAETMFRGDAARGLPVVVLIDAGAPGSRPRRDHGRAQLREGERPVDDPARPQSRNQADYRALLYAQGPLGAGGRDRS
jgi:carboxyl-terminal processing protease